jgi:hypothetical protein
MLQFGIFYVAQKALDVMSGASIRLHEWTRSSAHSSGQLISEIAATHHDETNGMRFLS